MFQQNPLMYIVKSQQSGSSKGIYSICSSNAFVIEACLARELDSDGFILIESTSNQVNQFGGYTGMNAFQFSSFVCNIAAKVGFPESRIILGGDHLGPNAWQNETAQSAMEKSCVLVSDSIKAGYSKIHLDASMKCADDDPTQPLDIRVSAKRAAEMCRAAEEAYKLEPVSPWKPCYIIGTEVPIPGGTLSGETDFSVTSTEDAQETLEITNEAFYSLGLEEAWKRVVGLVVQPGVEFGDSSLIPYDREKAAPLSKFIEDYENLIYEAHSTDYQTPESLKQMVADHFAILKVGPALTFAFREAVFALELMEQEWLKGRAGFVLSQLQDVLENVMLENPENWKKYYQGDEFYLRFARKYSYSDRSRYYWPDEKVQKSLKLLLTNLTKAPAPESLLSQYMPDQYRKVMSNALENTPLALIYDRIKFQISDYIYACQD
jgi:D-tagatose-1,6-bisphosphate aldolase subunit GatZ/KbaZ